MKLLNLLKIRKKKAAVPEQYYSLFVQTPSGQTVLADMMKAHHFYDSTMGATPYDTALQEGERNVILRILTIIDQHERSFEP